MSRDFFSDYQVFGPLIVGYSSSTPEAYQMLHEPRKQCDVSLSYNLILIESVVIVYARLCNLLCHLGCPLVMHATFLAFTNNFIITAPV